MTLYDNIIKISNISSYQNVLEINTKNYIEKLILDRDAIYDFIQEDDLSSLFKINKKYETIICPFLMYKNLVKNRNYLLYFIEKIIANNGQFIFSIPSKKNIILNKKYDYFYIDSMKITKIVDRSNYLKVKFYKNFLNYNIEFWDKQYISDPLSIFSNWNNSKYGKKLIWQIENSGILNFENHLIFVVDCKQNDI